MDNNVGVQDHNNHCNHIDSPPSILNSSSFTDSNDNDAIPKLPKGYIHRDTLVNQVVNCLLLANDDHDNVNNEGFQTSPPPSSCDGDIDNADCNTDTFPFPITCITSSPHYHANAAGANANGECVSHSSNNQDHNPSSSQHHGGDGKTTVAVAAIQTVEIRQHFSDGIAWIQLGSSSSSSTPTKPLCEERVREIYEEVYRQLMPLPEEQQQQSPTIFHNNITYLEEKDKTNQNLHFHRKEEERIDHVELNLNNTICGRFSRTQNDKDEQHDNNDDAIHRLVEQRHTFQGGALEGIKQDFIQLFGQRKILLCLDNVFHLQDLHWFLFHSDSNSSGGGSASEAMANGEKKKKHQQGGSNVSPFQILLTTSIPNLLHATFCDNNSKHNGDTNYGCCCHLTIHKVFLDKLSEHQAKTLFFSSTGKRPAYDGYENLIWWQKAKLMMQACGGRNKNNHNAIFAPLLLRLASGICNMEQQRNRCHPKKSVSSWFTFAQMTTQQDNITVYNNNVMEWMVNLAIQMVPNQNERNLLRPCFVVFAMIVLDHFDRNHINVIQKRGIPKEVILDLFNQVLGFRSMSAEQNSLHDEDRSGPVTATATNHEDCEKGAVVATSCISPAVILESLEKMNLIEQVGYFPSPTRVRKSNNVSKIPCNDEKQTRTSASSFTNAHVSPCYLMHKAIQAVAQEMASDTINFFLSSSQRKKSAFTTANTTNKSENTKKNNDTFQIQTTISHELMVAAFIKNKESNPLSTKQPNTFSSGIAHYFVEFLPFHLVRIRDFASVGDILTDRDFVSRRVTSMGTVEATKRQVADLVELWNAVCTNNKERSSSATANDEEQKEHESFHEFQSHHQSSIKTPEVQKIHKYAPFSSSSSFKKTELSSFKTTKTDNECGDDDDNLDIGAIMRDASRIVIDQVYSCSIPCPPSRHHDILPISTPPSTPTRTTTNKQTSQSLNIAICLSTVGKTLVTYHQIKNGILMLEEAVGVYRSILGPYHTDVARSLGCVADALSMLGEHRIALLKLEEVERIYQMCHAMHHLDALRNGQVMAEVLSDLGEFERACERYERLIRMMRRGGDRLNEQVKSSVINSAMVARTMNSYAMCLDKHEKIEEAVLCYEEARAIFESASSIVNSNNTTATKITSSSMGLQSAGRAVGGSFMQEISTINERIAFLKANNGDIEGAISVYQDGIMKTRQQMAKSHNNNQSSSSDATDANVLMYKHILTSLSKIGSLQLKKGDHRAALEAFQSTLKEYNDKNMENYSAPPSSSTRTIQRSISLCAAKAHIKCATILRILPTKNSGTENNNNNNNNAGDDSRNHLQKALKLYSRLYGTKHADTKALAASLWQWRQEDMAIVSSTPIHGYDGDCDDDNFDHNYDDIRNFEKLCANANINSSFLDSEYYSTSSPRRPARRKKVPFNSNIIYDDPTVENFFRAVDAILVDVRSMEERSVVSRSFTSRTKRSKGRRGFSTVHSTSGAFPGNDDSNHDDEEEISNGFLPDEEILRRKSRRKKRRQRRLSV